MLVVVSFSWFSLGKSWQELGSLLETKIFNQIDKGFEGVAAMNVWENWFDACMLGHLFHMSFPSFIRPEVSRMKVFENNLFYDFDTFQIWFVVMICLRLGFAVMILIWFQLCFLMWLKLVIWSQPIGTICSCAIPGLNVVFACICWVPLQTSTDFFASPYWSGLPCDSMNIWI